MFGAETIHSSLALIRFWILKVELIDLCGNMEWVPQQMQQMPLLREKHLQIKTQSKPFIEKLELQNSFTKT
jgi:hypothetical protein